MVVFESILYLISFILSLILPLISFMLLLILPLISIAIIFTVIVIIGLAVENLKDNNKGIFHKIAEMAEKMFQ